MNIVNDKPMLCDVEGFRAKVKEKAALGRDHFFTFFDGPKFATGGNAEKAYEKAAEIFRRHMLPFAEKYLGGLRDKVALDVGYGGGGQLFEASKIFERVVGVDVHEETQIVADELVRRGCSNFELLTTADGMTIPRSGHSVDFIYSWVTLIHVNGWDGIVSYVEESFRVLRPGGIAVLYFGRLVKTRKVEQTYEQWLLDIEKEKENELGYRDGGPTTKVNNVRIVVAMWKMEELSKEVGFEVLERTGSWSDTPDGVRYYGQHGIVLRKPDA